MAKRRDDEWKRARELCRLSADDVRKAKELGLNPRKLAGNMPSKSQPWKAPVNVWVRELYAKRFPSQTKDRPPARPRPRRDDVKPPEPGPWSGAVDEPWGWLEGDSIDEDDFTVPDLVERDDDDVPF